MHTAEPYNIFEPTHPHWLLDLAVPPTEVWPPGGSYTWVRLRPRFAQVADALYTEWVTEWTRTRRSVHGRLWVAGFLLKLALVAYLPTFPQRPSHDE